MKNTTEQNKVNQLLKELKNEKINTWFDLGLFIDQFRDKQSKSGFDGDFDSYKNELKNGGIGFISYYYAVDGVTVEVEKYSKIFKNLFPNIGVHYIAGNIKKEANELIHPDYSRKVIKEIDGFDNWSLYKDFFQIKMERGSKEYNELIGKFWNEVLVIVQKLGSYIEDNGINILYLLNVCSNPGNVSLSLATVLLSEYMGIPVINNSHDFYWEGGTRDVEREVKGIKKGPRDFFFHNSHVGEFFSVLEVLFPWESRSWINLNINKLQSEHLVKYNGQNPANINLIGTAVEEPIQLSKRDVIKAFMQISTIFANNKKDVTVHTATNHIKSERSLKPILLGYETINSFDFVNNNIIFLQPTRIVGRKSIELNFKLIKQLFQNPEFSQKFVENPKLSLSVIVSGPIPLGQQGYFENLVSDFANFLKDLPTEFKSKVLLGFLFSEFDKHEFRKKYNSPIDIEQLYHVASLILLPSQTEGRGLPIIEAAAMGTPIFCRQYEPREVYDDVIGYHLSEENRLRVLEFKGKKISNKLISKIINHVFYPQETMPDTVHNKQVIKNRYSIEALGKNICDVIEQLHTQLQSINESQENVQSLMRKYKKMVNFENDDLKAIMNKESRHYLPGYGRLAFMTYLKSLIDPSFFRVEEHYIRGLVLGYAKLIETDLLGHKGADKKLIQKYYNTVDNIFKYQDGEFEIRHDHALSYRHRSKKHFVFYDFTYQELTGIVNMIYQDVLKPKRQETIIMTPQFFSDWNLALFQLTNSKSLGIDNRDILTEKLKTNVPKGYFPGRYIKHELEAFVLQPVRYLLNLSIEEELTDELVKFKAKEISNVYIFVHEPCVARWFSNSEIKQYLENGNEPELTILYKAGIIKIIESEQWSKGVHFPQMGAKAIKILRNIKEKNGFIITNGEHAAMMTDIININHFHIGRAETKMTAKIMGIEKGQGYIQFVPAGVRTTLAYPTPIQTSKDFDKAIHSDLFNELKGKIGEEKLYDLISKDAEENGNPIVPFLENLKNELNGTKDNSNVISSFAGGVYSDGLPWGGVTAKIDTQKTNWKFAAHVANSEPKNVPNLIKEYKENNKSNKKVELAWNGGYILNPELVGKLGLPETYIGSPLGLLIMNGEVKCPPLFNKPSFIIYKDGKVDIKLLNIENGFCISDKEKTLNFSKENFNKHSETEACFYNLSYENEEIEANGNIIVRIAGNTVKQILKTKKGETAKVIAVGITLSIPEKLFSENMFIEEKSISIKMNNSEDFNWDSISYAIEAGPLLLKNGEVAIDMHKEGWKTENSIKTQAARLDFTDMRGPKIAVGIDKNGKLIVLMVNGRIRESVGATHFDMANILKEYGMDKAMGFDPGGSSTLVVNGEIMNISPYNKEYEKDIYSLPPEPRFVANIIMGWIE